MENFGDRLEYVVKHSDYKTGRSFCENAKISTTTLSRLIKGHTKPSYEFLVTLLVLVPDVDIFWLLTGQRNDLRAKVQKLERENLEAKHELEGIKSYLAKPSSNRNNPQLTIDFVNHQNGLRV